MMRNVKRLGLALLMTAASAAGAAPADRVAPPVVRKRSAATSAPSTPSPASNAATPRTGCTAPCATPTPPATEEAYFSALTASAGPGADPILDKGLVRAMSRLMAANRCPDAIALAAQNGRAALATRAKQLCKVG